MAIKKGPSFRSTLVSGTFGNLCKAEGKAVFSGDAAGTEIHVLRLEPGTKLYGCKAVHDALGAGTTLKVGYRYVDEADGAAVDDAFGSAASTGVATISMDDTPITLEKPAIITLTNTGGTATGNVTVIPEYEYLGVK